MLESQLHTNPDSMTGQLWVVSSWQLVLREALATYTVEELAFRPASESLIIIRGFSPGEYSTRLLQSFLSDQHSALRLKDDAETC